MKILQRVTVFAFVVMVLIYCGVTLYENLMVDSTPPTISCESKEIVVSVKDNPSVLLQGVTAWDDRDGDLTDQVEIKSVSQLITDDTAQVSYIVFDSSNNMTVVKRIVRYSDYEKPRFALSQPLVYTQGEKMALLERLSATDSLDGDISGSICVITENVSDAPGVYSVTVQATNSLGDTAVQQLKLVVCDTENQLRINLKEYLVYLEKGQAFDARAYILGVQGAAGVTAENVTVTGSVNSEKAGTYHIAYSVQSGELNCTVYLTVVVS